MATIATKMLADDKTSLKELADNFLKPESEKKLSSCDHVITVSNFRSMPYSCKKCGRLFKTHDGRE
jgi:hypothetical protein